MRRKRQQGDEEVDEGQGEGKIEEKGGRRYTKHWAGGGEEERGGGKKKITTREDLEVDETVWGRCDAR